MSFKIETPKGYTRYNTIEGKFAAHIGPYFIKHAYPNTVFGMFIGEKQSNLNEVAHGGFLMSFAASNKFAVPKIFILCVSSGSLNDFSTNACAAI